MIPSYSQNTKACFKRRILHVSNTIRIIFDQIEKKSTPVSNVEFKNYQLSSIHFKRRTLHVSN